MSVYVFTGPTLSPRDARQELEAVYLPPVAQGDVYRVALRRPQAIGIIDGYFERVPAVWHKEILWAMSQGIHVFGSASMGALRAAELVRFGMEGVGAIFEAYRDGMVTDDDEVAVAHGAAESGYHAHSEAMVNIRRTLTDAESTGVIGAATRAALERIAKALFYPERAYPLIMQRAAEEGLSAGELGALRVWLSAGRIDQKRSDALTMLRVMRERLAAGLTPKRVRYRFEYTDAWDTTVRHAGHLQLDGQDRAETIHLDTLLDELRLEGDAYTHAIEGATARLLLEAEAQRQGVAAGAAAVQERAARFRREHRLSNAPDAKRWLEENDFSDHQFLRLMEGEERLHVIGKMFEAEALLGVPDYLRVTGAYARLLARARDKERALEVRGLANPSLADAGMTEEELLRWYFEQRLHRPVAEDPARYARSVGFTDQTALIRAALREFCYRGLAT